MSVIFLPESAYPYQAWAQPGDVIVFPELPEREEIVASGRSQRPSLHLASDADVGGSSPSRSDHLKEEQP